jgi:type VI secretion system protein ImpA
MLKRAKKMVRMDFMELLRDLAPGGTDQADLIFGLQPEQSE